MKKLIIIFLMLLVPTVAIGADGVAALKFEWEQAITDDFGGWILHYGTAPGMYDNEIIIPYDANIQGPVYTSEQTVTAPGSGVTLYFALSAFDSSGNHSEYSDEVSYTCPDTIAPPAPFNFTVKVVGD